MRLQASGSAVSARDARRQLAVRERRRRVVVSSTVRRLARTAIQTLASAFAACPRRRRVSGAVPRTFASGPSSARMTSASVICSAGRASQ